MMEELESKLGLHQEITIIYVVDGYLAIFSTNDGNKRVEEAHGQTIQAAINLLNEKMKKWNKITKYSFHKE